jgi:hypothetical protein
MSNLPDGLDENSMISAIAWEIVNVAFLRKAGFNELPNEEVFIKLTNEFIRARQAIYHGIPLKEPKKS